MRIFILADGEAKRWGNYQGTDKQLLKIDGEPLLHRTVRLLKEVGFDDIYIIGKYEVAGAKNFRDRENKSIIGKYEIHRPLWDGINSFAILYGDCFYTKEILQDLCERKTDKEHLHYSCHHSNGFTGKPYPEGYVHAVYDINFWRLKIAEYHDLLKAGHEHTIDWMFFRHLLGIDLHKHQPELMADYEVAWHDWTDDFDYPIDYDRFIDRWNKK